MIPTTGRYQHPIDKPLDAQLNPDLWNQVLGKDITSRVFGLSTCNAWPIRRSRTIPS